ncbi:MAG TPA: glutathione transferase GstA [Rhizomicrobium sp.]|jgi:glutathione S-transferase|nr:glutathione transferase GstA [Rhizomicrobium sp.]
MKLYYSPGACSLSPHIVAEEAGIALEYVKVHLSTHKTDAGEDFYAINPKGYVPALALDDGSLLSEGPAIVQYLADLKPEANLIPRNGDVARYHVLEWLAYINSEMHKTFSPLFGPEPDSVKDAARHSLTKKFAFVDAALAGKSYLMGENFTVADAYLYVMTSWAIFQKIAVPDNVAAFRKRVTARPAVHRALKGEGLIS